MSRGNILRPIKGSNGRRPFGSSREVGPRTEFSMNETGEDTGTFGKMGINGPGLKDRSNVMTDINIGFAISDFGIIIAEIVAIIVLIKCKRLSYQVKYFSVNYLLANVIYNMVDFHYLISNYLPYGKSPWPRALGRDLMTFTSSVSWCSMALLSIERILALQLSLKYELVVTKKKVLVAIAAIWFINWTIFIGTFIGTIMQCGDLQLSACTRRDDQNYAFRSEKSMALGLRVSMFVYVAYSIIQMVTFVKLHFIIKSHLKYIRQFKVNDVTSSQRDKQKTSRFVIKLQMVHLILHIPVIVYFVSFEVLFLSGSKTQSGFWIRTASQCSLTLHAFLTLTLYTWNFKECRLIFFNMFCLCIGYGQRKVEKMRASVYQYHFKDSKGNGIKVSRRPNIASLETMKDSSFTRSTEVSP